MEKVTNLQVNSSNRFQRYAKKTGGASSEMMRGNSDVGFKKCMKRMLRKKIDQAKFFTVHVKLIFGKSKKLQVNSSNGFCPMFKKMEGGGQGDPPPLPVIGLNILPSQYDANIIENNLVLNI